MSDFFQRAEDVNVAGEFGGFGFNGRVAFNRNEVHGGGHVEVIEFSAECAQVDGDGMVGANFMQNIGLHPDKGDDGVAAKNDSNPAAARDCARLAHTWASALGRRRKQSVHNNANPGSC